MPDFHFPAGMSGFDPAKGGGGTFYARWKLLVKDGK